MEFQSTAFCAVLKNGKTSRAEATHITDFKKQFSNKSVAWVDLIVSDLEKDGLKAAVELGFSESLFKKIMKSKRSGYEDLDSELAIMLPAISVEKMEVHLRPMLILMNGNILLTLHSIEAKRFFRIRRYAETYLKTTVRMPKVDALTLLLTRILDENNTRNFDYLYLIEEQGDALSRDLSDSKMAREKIGHEIYQTKHALITYLSGLWAVQDALNAIQHGDAKLISDNPKLLSKLTALVFDVRSQIGLAEHMSDVLSSGLEVLQSIYNNQLQILNNRLAMLVAYLTIIGTAVLVPNTIATVMSSSAFNLTTADEGWYISLIVGSTIVATVLSFLFVERMGLLPKAPDRA